MSGQAAFLATSGAAHWAVFEASHAGWRAVAARHRARHPAAAVLQLASSVMAGLHGLIVTCWTGWLLQHWDWHTFDGANSASLEAALLFSAAYFAVDLFAYLLPYTPQDVLYMLHHVVSLLFIGTALHLGRGAAAVAFGLFIGACACLQQRTVLPAYCSARKTKQTKWSHLKSWLRHAAGEFTNPLFHIFLTLQLFAPSSKAAAVAYRYWALAFTAIFLLVRSVLAPPAAIWFTWRAMAASAPLPHRLIQAVTALGIMVVSQLFAADFVRTTRAVWRQHLASKQEQQRRQGQDLRQLAGQAKKPQRRSPTKVYVLATSDSAADVGGHRPPLKQE